MIQPRLTWSAILLAALTATCNGCTTEPPGPSIAIVFDQAEVPADVQAFTRQGAYAWGSLGIGYTDEAQPECPTDWAQHPELFPCSITVHIDFAAGSTIGGAGITANRHSTLQIELTGDQLTAVAAHEIGHSLWGSGHVDGTAIMSSPPTSLEPTQLDRDHAAAKGWAP